MFGLKCIGIQTIAYWLGHSEKVMLKHYGRVREDDYQQVTQYQSQLPKADENEPKSLTIGHF